MIDTERILSQHECAQVMRAAIEKGMQPGQTFNHTQDYRRDLVCFLQEAEIPVPFQHLKSALTRYALLHQIDAQHLSFVTVSRYAEGAYYNWHHDIDWTKQEGLQRKVSVSVQLSFRESYDGGVLQFDEVSHEAEKRQGYGTLFPSYLRHCVTPVTRGQRYSVTGWLEGPQWR